MAAPRPVRVNTIGRESGRVYDGGFTFEEALIEADSLRLSKEPLQTPIVKNREKGLVGEVNIPDLPLVTEPANKLRQWIEIIHPYEETVSREDLEQVSRVVDDNQREIKECQIKTTIIACLFKCLLRHLLGAV